MKYSDLDKKQRKFLDELVYRAREFIAVGDKVLIDKGEYAILDSKTGIFMLKLQ